jgi:hypothetical protein
MWIVKNNSFLSIVADRNDKDRLLVRARIKGDIEAVFPDAEVETTPEADYLYRAFLPRARVARTIADSIESIDYPNFKGSVIDKLRHDIYYDIWRVMHRAQEYFLKLGNYSRATIK